MSNHERLQAEWKEECQPKGHAWPWPPYERWLEACVTGLESQLTSVRRERDEKVKRYPMTARDFCFWLQGFFEIERAGNSGPIGLSDGRTEVVRKHLALVFEHEIDPSMGGQEKQAKLNAVHGDKKMRC